MNKFNSFNLGIEIPPSINNLLSDLEYEEDFDVINNERVFVFKEYVLKIAYLAQESINEIKTCELLKDRISSLNYITHEIYNKYIFLLRKRLDGIRLDEDCYLNNPDLVLKLASDALKTIYSINITGLSIRNTNDILLDRIKKAILLNKIDFNLLDKEIIEGFNSLNDIVIYLENNQPIITEPVLCHGDLRLNNILCKDDKIICYTNTSFAGVSEPYHDMFVLFSSIKKNLKQVNKYEPKLLKKFYSLMSTKIDPKKDKYYSLLHELVFKIKS